LPVRKLKIAGVGKQANRIEATRVLGQAEVRKRATTDVDPGRFRRSATEVTRRLEVSCPIVFNRRHRARWV
jgi:hypothetical protein